MADQENAGQGGAQIVPAKPVRESDMLPSVPRDERPSGALFPTKEEWQMIEFMAKTFVQAGALPKGIDTVPKAIVILQAGVEAGLTPLQSFNSFYIVNGKVTMYGEVVPQQILKAGHKITWGKCDETVASVTITRGDTGESMSQTLTWDTAVKRGYTRNEIWHKFPENMLKWRVLSMVAKFIAPDALRGIQIKEDLEGSEDLDRAETKPKEITTGKTREVKTENAVEHKPLTEALEETEEGAADPKKLFPDEPKKKGRSKKVEKDNEAE